MNRNYVTAPFHAGTQIEDVMNEASHVRISESESERWYPVLGYDSYDDVLCVENYNGDDWEFAEASQVFSYKDFKIAVNVVEEVA